MAFYRSIGQKQQTLFILFPNVVSVLLFRSTASHPVRIGQFK